MSGSSTLKVSNSTFLRNSAQDGGVARFTMASSFYFSDSLFQSNSATQNSAVALALNFEAVRSINSRIQPAPSYDVIYSKTRQRTLCSTSSSQRLIWNRASFPTISSQSHTPALIQEWVILFSFLVTPSSEPILATKQSGLAPTSRVALFPW